MQDHSNDIILRCSLPVPPERVWELWTTPEGIAAWWAPDGFATTVDVRHSGSNIADLFGILM